MPSERRGERDHHWISAASHTPPVVSARRARCNRRVASSRRADKPPPTTGDHEPGLVVDLMDVTPGRATMSRHVLLHDEHASGCLFSRRLHDHQVPEGPDPPPLPGPEVERPVMRVGHAVPPMRRSPLRVSTASRWIDDVTPPMSRRPPMTPAPGATARATQSSVRASGKRCCGFSCRTRRGASPRTFSWPDVITEVWRSGDPLPLNWMRNAPWAEAVAAAHRGRPPYLVQPMTSGRTRECAVPFRMKP